ncbi:2-hydroxyacid dehydrogenase [Sphingobacterium pedocola]|uniref:D-glycerate dehydrogenase n=1 Tax=Sphingobacterium pedocola TaxID=2082722 RepID=A0ABR9TD24_9SPHI|nr:D-glycerate dehydrogenase [Sphingobacterium pedocola]MBE8722527.1 D-glycerate dehydrogenase [Sphingobacterium pedocola]
MKVFIARNIPEKAIEHLKEKGLEVSINRTSKHLTREQLISQCRDKDFLILVGNAKLDSYFFEQCAHLKGIALTAVGFDHIDLDAATKAGIPVSNTAGSLRKTTADIAFLLMIAVSRKAFFQAKEVREKQKKSFDFMEDLGIEIENKTLGIYGLGDIGLEFAKMAKAAYGMKIIYHNRTINKEAENLVGAKYVSFDNLLTRSDVISAHVNLSPETKYKFNKDAFEKMKKSAIFINTARGKIHQEEDLIAALQQGEIWGAGLDVTDPEPISPENPLLEMPTVCILPHIGSATVEARTKMAVMAANNIICAKTGSKMPQVINKEVYKK